MKRSKLEIMACVLQYCLVPRSKTQIMFKGNLSFSQENTYLDLLTSRQLLSQNNGKYRITDKGLKFLSTYDQLDRMLNAGDLQIGEKTALSIPSSISKTLTSRGSSIIVEVGR